MKKIKLVIGFLFCGMFAFAQVEKNMPAGNNESEIEIRYDHFKKTFEHEMNATETGMVSKEEKKYVSPLKPSPLPEWISGFDTVSDAEYPMAFGISDPGLDSALALKQAEIRALGMLAIFNGCTIQNLTDNYTAETTDDEVFEKFSSFSQITAKANAGLQQMKIYKTGFTDYGEAIVLAGFADTASMPEANPVKVLSDYFMWEEGDHDALKVYDTYHFHVARPGAFSTGFACHNTKNSVLISSELDSLKLEFDYGRFRYFTRNGPQPDEETVMDFSIGAMSEGLWNAYLVAVLRQIEMSEKQTSEIKRMDDQYNGKMQGLNREISNIRHRFMLSGIFIADNNLYVRLTTL